VLFKLKSPASGVLTGLLHGHAFGRIHERQEAGFVNLKAWRSRCKEGE